MTLPPASLMQRVLIAWNSSKTSLRSSGSQRSERPVESTISQNSTVSWRRSLVLPRRSCIEHSRQSFEPVFSRYEFKTCSCDFLGGYRHPLRASRRTFLGVTSKRHLRSGEATLGLLQWPHKHSPVALVTPCFADRRSRAWPCSRQ